MIKAAAKDLVLLGLSRRNCERLLEGKPIFITPESMDGKLKQAVLLLAGETEADIVRELQAHPDVFDLSQAKVKVVPPGVEDLVQIRDEVFDARTGERAVPDAKLTPEERSRHLVESLREIAATAEAQAPDGLRVAVFLYAPHDKGEVAHVSRDRELTKAAVRRWLDGVAVPPPKASA